MERGRKRRSHLRLRDCKVAGLDLRRVEADRESDGLALQAGEGTHDGGGGRMAVENPARPAGNDHWTQTVEDDGGIAVRSVDRGGDLIELVLERRVVHLRRGSNVCAEEAQVQATKTAKRPETLTLPADGIDRGPSRPGVVRLAGRVAAVDGQQEARLSIVQFCHPAPWTVLAPVAVPAGMRAPARFPVLTAADLFERTMYRINRLEPAGGGAS